MKQIHVIIRTMVDHSSSVTKTIERFVLFLADSHLLCTELYLVLYFIVVKYKPIYGSSLCPIAVNIKVFATVFVIQK